MSKNENHPEPVPYASQLAVLPFLAGVEGFCRQQTSARLRITIHRITAWEGDGYFQQLCTYFGTVPKAQDTVVGRMLPVSVGIIGFAFENKKIARTKKYESQDALLADLALDMKENKELKAVDKVPPAYLAIPFIGKENEVVLVLYAECDEFNFFAKDSIVETINSMCYSYSELFDWLAESDALPTIRNFPLRKGIPLKRDPSVYKRLQELVALDVPRFKTLGSFNYETTVV